MIRKHVGLEIEVRRLVNDGIFFSLERRKYKAVLSTKLFDEGISCHRLDTLYLTCPSNNPIKLEQRVGRIIREHPDKQVPMIVDWWLSGGIVARQQTKRLEWYKQRGYYIL